MPQRGQTAERNATQRATGAGRYERAALSLLAQEDDSHRVSIQIWYNGGFPRTHSGVSLGFLRRLEAFLDKHPKCDVEWELP